MSPQDIKHCQAILAKGSRSFNAAAKLLPWQARLDAAALYAFCREADDTIDHAVAPQQAFVALSARLDGIVQAGRTGAVSTLTDPTDRALADLIGRNKLPTAPLRALLEGFLWDASGRTYDTLDDTLAYCARVAASVGVMMCHLLGVDEPWVLARAADMGTAMQLTNIARDVGEDARQGRVYLPDAWLKQAGVVRADFLLQPQFTPALATQIARLTRLASQLYRQAHVGVAALPVQVRAAIYAAGFIYEDIGQEVALGGFDSISLRAHVGGLRKVALIAQALGKTVTSTFIKGPDSLRLAKVLPANAFLLTALQPHPNDATTKTYDIQRTNSPGVL